MKCVLQKCENWLLMELELKEAKVNPNYRGVDGNVKYLMKYLYYGEKYSLKEFYKKCLTKVLSYRLSRYKENEHYQMLPDSNKQELLESRVLQIEDDLSYKRLPNGALVLECSPSFFQ